MKTPSPRRKRGFTLLETVIAIGVLAVLLTGFMIVFAPAAAGIKKSISVQEADRLVSTLEQELVSLRPGNEVGLPAKTPVTSPYNGFDKAFDWIMKTNLADSSLFVYQYRGSLSQSPRDDGTAEAVPDIKGKLPGKDYNVQTMLRRRNDAKFLEDLAAVEGRVYLVKCTQLVFDSSGQLKTGTFGKIIDPKGTAQAVSADAYPEAVIAFSADFYGVPGSSPAYLKSGGTFDPTKLKSPLFSRNLAVRR